MKKLFLLVGFLLFICPPSSAIDLQDLGTDTNGYPSTGLDRIRNAMEQNQNSMGDPFLQGVHPGGTQAPSAVKAIMDELITKGLASPYMEDVGDPEAEGDTTLNDLPFFSGEGTGLFNPPEEASGEWFASPNDDWGWFYWPDDSDIWFDPGFWSE